MESNAPPDAPEEALPQGEGSVIVSKLCSLSRFVRIAINQSVNILYCSKYRMS